MAAVEAAHAAGMPRNQIDRFLTAGYVPQPKQCQFHAAAREADRPDGPLHVAMGGDRAGAKSHAVFAQIALDDAQRYDGLTILYLRRVGKAAKQAMQQLVSRVLPLTPHDYSEHKGLITFPNGSLIQVGHFRDERDVDAYQGLEYDIIVVEEAPQLSKEKLDLLFGSMRSSKPGWKARAYLAGNPGGIGHQHFKQTYVDPYRHGRETWTRFIPMSWRDNAFVAPEYIAYLDGLTGILARMWRDGDWDVAAGQYFVTWSADTHVIRPFEIPQHWPIWVSMDYGHAHPHVVQWHTKHEGTIYTIAEHTAQYMLPEQHVGRMRDITQGLLARPWEPETMRFVGGHDFFSRDRDGRSVADDYADQGIRVERANVDRITGAQELLRRLGNPEQAIAPSWFVFDRCTSLTEQMPRMINDPRRLEDVKKVDANAAGDGGDDSYDCARYGLMEEWKRPKPKRKRLQTFDNTQTWRTQSYGI